MAAKGATAPKARKEPNAAVKAYLVFYNVAQVIGWSYLLYQLISYHINPPKDVTLWDTVKYTVIIFQNAALLEVFHAAVGFVVTNVFMTLCQVYSRVMVVCLVLLATPTAPLSVGLPLALFAWTITEIIRYSFYALNLFNAVPYFLIWCRYTFFIALYPIGITGELLCIWAAYVYSSETNMWSFALPNTFNFTFDYGYFLLFSMIAYIPVFPQLYLYMFGQRKKVIVGESSRKKTK
ncbi:hypothetical protein FOCC_FOCC006686 [Frankliniella occidentalis]|uniref:Very-long-chain (3R)-3-hydroxyacyl-CoA dehydratase n=1 Tax=Frankliniella occidentalis TaxID=133901 RepID=A0A6J1TNJ6_FRAOC|nr:very-long-chain (3R)-3-hydroxyacyl-CoA dehydratase hpo-8 [Frankliniella occidentalis]KAE8746572.1 hypothetical protein FOCC_FOCC006686 [Frankliniella occidentalis]